MFKLAYDSINIQMLLCRKAAFFYEINHFLRKIYIFVFINPKKFCL